MAKKAQLKEWRKAFRNDVFERDGGRCVMCGDSAEDAHHITDRNEIPNGGYVVENGISLCGPCHLLAEQHHSTGTAAEGFHPDDLYEKIQSTKWLAEAAAKRLGT